MRPLAVADFGNPGIVRYAPVPFASSAETIPRVQVDMYCETMNFTLS